MWDELDSASILLVENPQERLLTVKLVNKTNMTFVETFSDFKRGETRVRNNCQGTILPSVQRDPANISLQQVSQFDDISATLLFSPKEDSPSPCNLFIKVKWETFTLEPECEFGFCVDTSGNNLKRKVRISDSAGVLYTQVFTPDFVAPNHWLIAMDIHK